MLFGRQLLAVSREELDADLADAGGDRLLHAKAYWRFARGLVDAVTHGVVTWFEDRWKR